MRSRPQCGTRARVARSGFAVPMSSPRYICRASAEMTVIGTRAPIATATAVLPTPVGPTMTGVRGWGSGAAEAAFKLFLRELNEARTAMYVVRRQRCGEEPQDQLPHFSGVERLPGLDRCPARVGCGEPLETILPTTKPSPGEIGDELLKAATGLEAWMRIRSRMHHDAAAGEWLNLEADAREQLAVRIDRIELRGPEVEGQGQQQPLRRRAVAGELPHDVFGQNPLV